MTEIKYMVVATFDKCNMKVKEAEFMIGLETPFYCGDSEEEAREIYNKLPNEDEQLIAAKVTFMSIYDNKMIKEWKCINKIL